MNEKYVVEVNIIVGEDDLQRPLSSWVMKDKILHNSVEEAEASIEEYARADMAAFSSLATEKHLGFFKSGYRVVRVTES